ncbi:hypothetical protein [Tsukamurella soli]|uniref:hypothetical protein n=1 Tax=Tsukamurella soli TaxID=644556 RepID=UPI0031E7ACA4
MDEEVSAMSSDDESGAGVAEQSDERRMSLEESRAQRAASPWDLAGSTPESRILSAETLIILDRRFGQETPQWVFDVYEGRLPA